MSLRIAPLHHSRYYARSAPSHCDLRQLRAANVREVHMAKAHTVFVYGTLLSEEIVQILLKRYPEVHKGLVSVWHSARTVSSRSSTDRGLPCITASVQGYSRYRIQGRVYPAILPTTPDDKLEGLVGLRT